MTSPNYKQFEKLEKTWIPLKNLLLTIIKDNSCESIEKTIYSDINVLDTQFERGFLYNFWNKLEDKNKILFNFKLYFNEIKSSICYLEINNDKKDKILDLINEIEKIVYLLK